MSIDERPFSFSLLVEVNSIRDGLRRYVDLSHEVEKMLDEKEAEVSARWEQTLSRAPADDHEDVHSSFAFDLRDYESTFRFLHREAMFLTLYNYFEHFLNKLCTQIGKEINSRVGLSDIRGQGITRALLFLELIPGFHFKTAIPEVMETIVGANALRNIVVHAGTELPLEKDQAVNRFVNSHPHLSGEPGQAVSLGAKFVADFAKTLHAFFDEFDAQMQTYMDRTWRRAEAARLSATGE